MPQDSLFDDLPPEQAGTLHSLIPEVQALSDKIAQHPNRCVREWGLGPEGKTCGECTSLVKVRYGTAYWKCVLRLKAHGGDTDRRLYFGACRKFEPRHGDIPVVYAPR